MDRAEYTFANMQNCPHVRPTGRSPSSKSRVNILAARMMPRKNKSSLCNRDVTNRPKSKQFGLRLLTRAWSAANSMPEFRIDESMCPIEIIYSFVAPEITLENVKN